MRLAFLDRRRELERLRTALRSAEGSFVVVYGRRRLGKSRLLQEALRGRRGVYFLGDERDGPLQRSALAREIDALVPGFAAVTYAEWEPLLERWEREAPAGATLVLDEFPYLVRSSPELPSLLQKVVDRPRAGRPHLVVSGSSQRMMQGLVLDAAAPLFGRAREILHIEPIPAGWIGRALVARTDAEAVDHYAIWGGTPRYWELAREHPDRRAALRALVLDPLGVLHREPERLLLDDLDEVARAASLMTLIGQGCHRVSEMGGRLGLPATSLARPLARLMDLGFVDREIPFGRSPRDTKRTSYRLADPFLRFCYRFVDANRSRLAAGQLGTVAAAVEAAWPGHVGSVWEDPARASVARLDVGGTAWGPASRWWGPGLDGKLLELDLVAEATDGSGRILVGEAKVRAGAAEVPRLLESLRARAARCPPLREREVTATVWLMHAPRARLRGVVTAGNVLRALR